MNWRWCRPPVPQAQLDKAVQLLLEVLQPTNTAHKPIAVVPGGSAVLQPVPLPEHECEERADPAPGSPGGTQHAAAVAAATAQQAAANQQNLTPNAWLERLKARQAAAPVPLAHCSPPPSPACQGAGAAAVRATSPLAAAAPEGQPQSVLEGWPPAGTSGSADSGGGSQDTSTASTAGSADSPHQPFSSSGWGGSARGSDWIMAAAPLPPTPSTAMAAAAEPAPREWSLWEPSGSPCLFDQLQTVVQEHHLLATPQAATPHQWPGPAPAQSPETCYFQVHGPAAAGRLAAVISGVAAERGAWVLLPAHHMLAALAPATNRRLCAAGAGECPPCQLPAALPHFHRLVAAGACAAAADAGPWGGLCAAEAALGGVRRWRILSRPRFWPELVSACSRHSTIPGWYWTILHWGWRDFLPAHCGSCPSNFVAVARAVPGRQQPARRRHAPSTCIQAWPFTLRL